MTCGTIFDAISRQLGIGVDYSRVPLDIDEYVGYIDANLPLDVLLRFCLDPLEMTYEFKLGTIWILMKDAEPGEGGGAILIIRLAVMGPQGKRLSGAVVHLVSPGKDQQPEKDYETGMDGTVTIVSRKKPVMLVVTCDGYKKATKLVNKGGPAEVRMELEEGSGLALESSAPYVILALQNE